MDEFKNEFIGRGTRSESKDLVLEHMKGQLQGIPEKALPIGCSIFLKLYLNESLTYEITLPSMIAWYKHMQADRVYTERTPYEMIDEATKNVLLPLYPNEAEKQLVVDIVDWHKKRKTDGDGNEI